MVSLRQGHGRFSPFRCLAAAAQHCSFGWPFLASLPDVLRLEIMIASKCAGTQCWMQSFARVLPFVSSMECGLRGMGVLEAGLDCFEGLLVCWSILDGFEPACCLAGQQ